MTLQLKYFSKYSLPQFKACVGKSWKKHHMEGNERLVNLLNNDRSTDSVSIL